MIARKQEIQLQLNQLIDALLVGGAFWLAYVIRHNRLVVMDSLTEIPEFKYFLWMLAVIMPFGPFLLELQGFYNYTLEKTVWKSLEQMARAAVWLGLLLGTAVIFLKLEVPSRSVLIIFGIFAPSVLLIKERIYIWRRIRQLKQGESGERIIMAGEKDMIRDIMRTFTRSQLLEIQVVEKIDLANAGTKDLIAAIHRHNVGRVVLAFSKLELDKVQRAIEACEIEGVEAWLSVDFIRTSVARPTYENLGRRSMLVFRATPDVSWALMVKNMIDRAGAVAGLVVLSPVFFLIALAVKMSSPGPAIFTQRRAGIHGRPFTMLKFRTMYLDAEKRHAELAASNEMSGPVFKSENDPRITSFGRWLRMTSLDELPQLVNVLFGDMSLVGPRPLPLYEVANFAETSHRRRLSMKPGLTCLWQIRGRNNVTNFEDWVRMDLEYIDHWSLGLDLRILLGTIPAVLTGAGAK
jgi:exopolysaccharide biosynthesis polyprenyl glycosylphosphotransferase